MKLKSLIMFSAAALAFAACSNDNEVISTQPTEGTTTVSVKLNMPEIINNMGTRGGVGIAAAAETPGTTGDTTPVEVKSATVVLNSISADEPTTQTITLTEDEMNTMTKDGITFTNVIAPRSIEVYVNCSKNEKQDDLSIYEANIYGLAVPLYKEVTTADTNVADDGCAFVWNAEEEQYDVTVTLKPRYARMEVSKISHDTNHESCIFTAANFKGLFLNNVLTKEVGSETASVMTADAWSMLNRADVYDSPTWSPATGVYAGTGAQAQWPAEEGYCYPYSVFEGVPPTLVFCVDNATLADNYIINGWGGTASDYLYAVVSTYKLATPLTGEENAALREKYGVADDGETISVFKKGNIYQITDIAIPDKAWNPTPTPPTAYTVVATVKVLPWTIVEGTVEW